MWIGHGPFEPYGYQGLAYAKGESDVLASTFVYQVQDNGAPNSSEQYWLVPVDKNGHQIGPVALKTSGVIMHGHWNDWKTSTKIDSSNFYPT